MLGSPQVSVLVMQFAGQEAMRRALSSPIPRQTAYCNCKCLFELGTIIAKTALIKRYSKVLQELNIWY